MVEGGWSEKLRELRKRGFDAEKLSEICTAHGHPISGSAIRKLAMRGSEPKFSVGTILLHMYSRAVLGIYDDVVMDDDDDEGSVRA
jgi:hypothetical protein